MSFIFMYVIAAYFFIILVLGESRYRVHSAIILLFTVLNIVFELPESTNDFEYVSNRAINIAWDGFAGLLMVCCLPLDKLASKQSLLFAFAVTCHCMIIYDLTITSSLLGSFFSVWYDELIIVVGILQIGVSYNGFTTAYNNALWKTQNIVFWISRCSNYLRKSLPSRKKRANST